MKISVRDAIEFASLFANGKVATARPYLYPQQEEKFVVSYKGITYEGTLEEIFEKWHKQKNKPKVFRINHHPDCCCEYNPETPEPQQVVISSNCCPVHNTNPVPCLADPVCLCRRSHNK